MCVVSLLFLHGQQVMYQMSAGPSVLHEHLMSSWFCLWFYFSICSLYVVFCAFDLVVFLFFFMILHCGVIMLPTYMLDYAFCIVHQSWRALKQQIHNKKPPIIFKSKEILVHKEDILFKYININFAAVNYEVFSSAHTFVTWQVTPIRDNSFSK